MEEKESKKNYELACLISPDLNDSELREFSKKMESSVSTAGKVLNISQPRKIILGYPIQKKTEAHFLVFEFEGESDKAEALKKNLEKEKTILRFLLIKKRTEPARKPRKKDMENIEIKPVQAKPDKEAEFREQIVDVDKIEKSLENAFE